jgi:CheY-like chemotaxis protein
MGFSQISDKQCLLVDDNPEEVFMLTWALEKAGILELVHCVSNGLDAISFLKACVARRGPGYKVPALILLRAEMAGMNGYEVLDWVSRQAALAKTHILMLANASARADSTRQDPGSTLRASPSLWQEHMELANEIKALLTSTKGAGDN